MVVSSTQARLDHKQQADKTPHHACRLQHGGGRPVVFLLLLSEWDVRLLSDNLSNHTTRF